ncbi:MAG: DUF512 domain-containing protein [Acidimicrobiales bacterium]
MESPLVVAVSPGSAADRAGVVVGDALVSINGEAPRDVIRYQLLVDGPEVSLELDRGGLPRTVDIRKADGEPLGIDVNSAVFDQVRTCDNHCPFCFIYQLPPGMRSSLYLKDDDYRLSFLYGNFTTLTRFTEADLERVVTERLSPLYVSIHATDPELRTRLLRNRRGAMSLRWLRALLDHGIEVHGQIVVCPGLNDGDALDATLTDVLDQYPELASLAVVPLGVSDHSSEPELRPHTVAEASRVIDIVEEWQTVFQDLLGRRLVFVGDEYYLLADRPFPPADRYEGFPMHEDGIGMARQFELEFTGRSATELTPRSGFFAAVDGAPATGYRAPRTATDSTAALATDSTAAPAADSTSGPAAGCATGLAAGNTAPAAVAAPAARCGAGPGGDRPVRLRPRPGAPLAVVTSAYGARVLGPIVARHFDGPPPRFVVVDNRFFGGNIAVSGLMVGADVARCLADQPEGHRYLLPDVCLTEGRFLDGMTVDELPRMVEVVATSGTAFRAALDRRECAA